MQPLTIANALRHADGYDHRPTSERVNPFHPSGPRTPEGKARSSQNALTHDGLTAQTVILRNEFPEEYQTELQNYVDHFRPQGLPNSISSTRSRLPLGVWPATP